MKNLTNQQSTRNTWAADILFLSAALFCLFFIHLGTRALFSPDEGRYAEIAREMVARNDYVTPYLNSIKYFEKPALFYWLTAASIKLGGLSLWAIRSVNALLAIAGCLLTYITGRVLYDRTTGLVATAILATSPLYFVMAHMISLDLTVTVFLTATLYSFLLAAHSKPGLTRLCFMWLSAAMAACAVLTKGLIGIVFPVIIILPWFIYTGEWRRLKKYYLVSSFLIFLAIAMPWHLLINSRNPEFFYFYFVEQHFLRYTTKEIGHYQPAWYFIPCLIIGFFPWIVCLPQALTAAFRNCRGASANLFFLLWATLIFIFFSFSKSKLIPYILPIFPALALLTASYLKTYFVIPRLDRGTQLPTFIVITIATALFLVFSLAAIPAIDTRTILPLITKIKPLLTANDDVITYNQYYQELPFYLERRITILNWRNEMLFGMQHQDTSAWMINDAAFWKKWHSQQRIFVFMSKSEFEKFKTDHPRVKIHLIGQTLNNVVISNQ